MKNGIAHNVVEQLKLLAMKDWSKDANVLFLIALRSHLYNQQWNLSMSEIDELVANFDVNITTLGEDDVEIIDNLAEEMSNLMFSLYQGFASAGFSGPLLVRRMNKHLKLHL